MRHLNMVCSLERYEGIFRAVQYEIRNGMVVSVAARAFSVPEWVIEAIKNGKRLR